MENCLYTCMFPCVRINDDDDDDDDDDDMIFDMQWHHVPSKAAHF